MNDTEKDPTSLFLGVTVMIGMLTFAAAITMPMGFLSDIEKMDIFKRLPNTSTQIAMGQLLAPVLALAVAQFATVLLFSFSALEYWLYWIATAAFAPLVSIVLLSMLNSLALFYPKRKSKGAVNEFENVGHLLVFLFFLFSTTVFIGMTLLVVGGVVYFITSNIPLILLSCWIVMVLFSIAGVFVTGWAFERFDVSKYTS